MRTLNPTEQGELTVQEWVVLKYADAMTQRVHVEDELFNELRRGSGLDAKRIIKLTGVIAGYNCVSRFLVALDVGEMNGKRPAGI
jgi:alkylhydroperoxidase family enzyme